MASFDRFDIAEAYCVLEWDYNKGGWLQERPSNQRRKEAIAVQLHRMGFKTRPYLEFRSLSDNAKKIYFLTLLRLRLPFDEGQLAMMRGLFTHEFLAKYPFDKKKFSGLYEATR